MLDQLTPFWPGMLFSMAMADDGRGWMRDGGEKKGGNELAHGKDIGEGWPEVYSGHSVWSPQTPQWRVATQHPPHIVPLCPIAR